MSKYLKLSDIATIRTSFCEDIEDYETWVLKTKPICLDQIKKFVEKQLIEGQYLIPVYKFYNNKHSIPLSLLKFSKLK